MCLMPRFQRRHGAIQNDHMGLRPPQLGLTGMFRAQGAPEPSEKAISKLLQSHSVVLPIVSAV